MRIGKSWADSEIWDRYSHQIKVGDSLYANWKDVDQYDIIKIKKVNQHAHHIWFVGKEDLPFLYSFLAETTMSKS